MSASLQANKRLAKALGWTAMVELGGSLLGMPPDGQPRERGQALVPDWCGDWAAAGPLIVAHGMSITAASTCVDVSGYLERFSEHGGNRDAAARVAIVKAATFRSERGV